MKIKRSSKIFFNKWLTEKKSSEVRKLLSEYARIVNYFIATYKDIVPNKRKFDLLIAVHIQKCIKETDTWLSARVVKNAFSEGYGMLKSYHSNLKHNNKHKPPVHYGKRAMLSETICTIYDVVTTKEFDINVTLCSIGGKKTISIPLKKHKQFNKWNSLGLRAKSVAVTDKYIQFFFKIETGIKKESGTLLGIDLGLSKLIATSKNQEFGKNYYNLLKKLKNKVRCSKSYYRCKEEIKEYINQSVKQLDWESLKLVVVEKLKNVKYKMKRRGRLHKNIRSFISNWSYRHILNRIQRLSEENRVSFRSVPAYYTSIDCPICGHRDKRNRKNQGDFCCQNCGHSDNADFNASKNLLLRFLTGRYGSCYKPKDVDLLEYLSIY